MTTCCSRLSFGDGSIGTIVYASGGDRGLPKEQLEVLGGGTAAVLDDFRTLQAATPVARRRASAVSLGGQDKGHAAELAAFLDAVRNGAPSPIDPAARRARDARDLRRRRVGAHRAAGPALGARRSRILRCT